jgi:hypothetical protein
LKPRTVERDGESKKNDDDREKRYPFECGFVGALIKVTEWPVVIQ